MTWIAAVVALLAFVGSGCGGSSAASHSDTTIALLLSGGDRPDSLQRSYFAAEIADTCDGCTLISRDAGGDPAMQREQGEAALGKGAEVLIVDPVHPKSATAIAEEAHARGVPVLSYEHLIEDAPVDHYVAFDAIRAGELQAEALAESLRQKGEPSGPVLAIYGALLDPRTALLKTGAHIGLDLAGVELIREYDTIAWSEDRARQQLLEGVMELGKGFAGVYASSDSLAGGAIKGMGEVAIDPAEKPTTGGGATLAGLRRILSGEQLMTTYEPARELAELGARIALDLAAGEEIPTGDGSEEIRNGRFTVAATLLEPIVVTRDNVESTVIEDGAVSAADLCEGTYRAACDAAGISG